MKTIALGIAALAVTALAAQAADLPAKPVYKAPVSVAAFSWTGCYIGANVGGASERDRYVTNAVGIFVPGVDVCSHDAAGVIAGGQVGCNYQMGAWVLGAEGMFDWADLSGSHLTPGGNTFSSRTHSLANATARAGYAFDRSLIYVKGGGAWMDTTQTGLFLGAPFTDNKTIRSGWTVGGGWEYAFSGNWSVKLEYDYYDFGNKATTACFLIGCVPSGVNDRITTHSGLIGVNYTFGAGLP